MLTRLSMVLMLSTACAEGDFYSGRPGGVGLGADTGAATTGDASTGDTDSTGAAPTTTGDDATTAAPRLDLPAPDDDTSALGGTTIHDGQPPPPPPGLPDVEDVQGCKGDECLPCGTWTLSWKPVEGATVYILRGTDSMGLIGLRLTHEGGQGTVKLTIKDGRIVLPCGDEHWRKCQDYYQITAIDVAACDGHVLGGGECSERVALPADQIPQWIDFGLCE